MQFCIHHISLCARTKWDIRVKLCSIIRQKSPLQVHCLLIAYFVVVKFLLRRNIHVGHKKKNFSLLRSSRCNTLVCFPADNDCGLDNRLEKRRRPVYSTESKLIDCWSSKRRNNYLKRRFIFRKLRNGATKR